VTTGALLLAAGRGTRMGGANKLTALLDGKPVVVHAADAALVAGLELVVVTGDRAAEVRASLAGRDVTFVDAPDYTEGLSASLRAGIAAVPADWDAVLVLLGDMPRLQPATLATLAAAPGIVVPQHNGQSGNPVRWPRRHFPALAALTGDTGGKALFQHLEIDVLAVDDPGILADIDTPQALAAMQRSRP